ncbi:prolipoprotein diacylglyceryl transferase, partial [Rothia dentocariosa]
MKNEKLPLDPIALSLGPIEIHWYGLIIAAAVLIGLLLAMKESEKRGLNKEIFMDLILYAVPISIVSAR